MGTLRERRHPAGRAGIEFADREVAVAHGYADVAADRFRQRLEIVVGRAQRDAGSGDPSFVVERQSDDLLRNRAVEVASCRGVYGDSLGRQRYPGDPHVDGGACDPARSCFQVPVGCAGSAHGVDRQRIDGVVFAIALQQEIDIAGSGIVALIGIDLGTGNRDRAGIDGKRWRIDHSAGDFQRYIAASAVAADQAAYRFARAGRGGRRGCRAAAPAKVSSEDGVAEEGGFEHRFGAPLGRGIDGEGTPRIDPAVGPGHGERDGPAGGQPPTVRTETAARPGIEAQSPAHGQVAAIGYRQRDIAAGRIAAHAFEAEIIVPDRGAVDGQVSAHQQAAG